VRAFVFYLLVRSTEIRKAYSTCMGASFLLMMGLDRKKAYGQASPKRTAVAQDLHSCSYIYFVWFYFVLLRVLCSFKPSEAMGGKGLCGEFHLRDGAELVHIPST
jgi:hypothetical protein